MSLHFRTLALGHLHQFLRFLLHARGVGPGLLERGLQVLLTLLERGDVLHRLLHLLRLVQHLGLSALDLLHEVADVALRLINALQQLAALDLKRLCAVVEFLVLSLRLLLFMGQLLPPLLERGFALREFSRLLIQLQAAGLEFRLRFLTLLFPLAACGGDLFLGLGAFGKSLVDLALRLLQLLFHLLAMLLPEVLGVLQFRHAARALFLLGGDLTALAFEFLLRLFDVGRAAAEFLIHALALLAELFALVLGLGPLALDLRRLLLERDALAIKFLFRGAQGLGACCQRSDGVILLTLRAAQTGQLPFDVGDDLQHIRAAGGWRGRCSR